MNKKRLIGYLFVTMSVGCIQAQERWKYGIVEPMLTLVIIVTFPLPLKMEYLNSSYTGINSKGWSSTSMANLLSLGFMEGPLGTTQLFNTPSTSKRKSK